MPIPLFLAMTATEFSFSQKKPEHLAWMSVHFSQSGRGLSNLPPMLPSGSIIILDDQTPWDNHDLEQVCQRMTGLLLRDRAYGLLLDFEREPCPETQSLARALSQCCREIGCGIAMPQSYLTENGSCFCPPLPCTTTWSAASFPQGPVWLDVTPTAAVATIGSDRVAVTPADLWECNAHAKTCATFRDPSLGCFYYSRQAGTEIKVSLFDTPETVYGKLQNLSPQIQLAITPWREFMQRDWYAPSMSS